MPTHLESYRPLIPALAAEGGRPEDEPQCEAPGVDEIARRRTLQLQGFRVATSGIGGLACLSHLGLILAHDPAWRRTTRRRWRCFATR